MKVKFWPTSKLCQSTTTVPWFRHIVVFLSAKDWCSWRCNVYLLCCAGDGRRQAGDHADLGHGRPGALPVSRSCFLQVQNRVSKPVLSFYTDWLGIKDCRLRLVRRCNGTVRTGTTARLGYWKVGLEWPDNTPPGHRLQAGECGRSEWLIAYDTLGIPFWYRFARASDVWVAGSCPSWGGRPKFRYWL